MGGEFGADDAVRAGAVVDHDLLAQAVGELDAEVAAQHVIAAARREWNDEADRFVRKVARLCFFFSGICRWQ
ncbi:hypothetical protein D3C83_142930 [compost metagenome]